MDSKPFFIQEAVRQFGFKEGTATRESAETYKRILRTPHILKNNRLIVCRDGIQIIHQERKGGRWRNVAYYASESGFKRGHSAISLTHDPNHPKATNRRSDHTEPKSLITEEHA